MSQQMAPPQKPMSFGPSVRRLLARLRPERRGVVLVVVLGVVGVGLNVLGPRLLGHGTDLIFRGVIGRQLPEGASKEQAVERLRDSGENTFADMVAGMDVTPGQGVDFTALGWVLLGVLALYLGAALFTWLQAYLLNEVVQRTMLRLRSDVENKVHRLPLRYFDTHARGDVLSRVTNDIDNISQSVSQTMSQLLTSVLTVLGVLTMMVVISPLLALIALVTIPLSILLTARIAKRSQREFVAQWQHTGALNAHVEETHTGHALVTVFGRQDEAEREFAEKNEQLFRASFTAQFVSGIIRPAMMFVGSLNYVAIAVVGGLRVASGTMSLGEVQAFIQYSQQFTQPLSQLASMVNLLQSGVASAERVFEFLDEPEESAELPVTAVTGRHPDVDGRVVFEQVSFSYDPEEPLIENLSLVAEPGTTVAIVGPTGAGKTTLVNLIMRFYELDGGRITVDGRDVAEMRRDELRSKFGMVLQDAWLFGGTIRDNIAYGDPEATDEQIHAAAEATYADRFVHSLPDGYDTVIDEEGDNVSAGEKQLLTIARAFLANPDILILDEATSSVDTRTELLVQQAMAALRSDRTSFVIAHRLSTIRDADLILVMRDGGIVEQGTHTELLERRGAYYELYNSQFTAPEVEEV
ncbi:ATP-binding cassette subfamily B protein [Haloactinopolyspora alba]|uniref:Fatty acid ABC transporter ATP-binding/permease protein n=1 Tax=Haloactinopolyspora alba TaxID=648780 RepID=A0A2P8E9A2_9ACTN|nr:ABC transporter ATP-binding protein [Haloactinopolyspora alba]PSL06034.1 ATP-binding cassette subfamily B protein [Haloactinopolyspora alba]